MKIILIFITLTLFLSEAHGRQSRPTKGACRPYNTEKAFFCVELVKVYDGDTITINIPNTHTFFGKSISLRIRGIDTPEIRGKSPCEKRLARQARDYLLALLSRAYKVDVRNIDRGKYFRIVSDVYVDGKSVAGLMMKSGFARDYWGGSRKPWDKACL